MTDNPSLSGEEIAALMSEVRDGSPVFGASSAARPFAFGSEAARPMSALPALDRMNERMARRVRELVEPFARAKPTVAAEPTQVRPFAEWSAAQAEFSSLSLYSFRPLKGSVLLSIGPALVSRLVDAFYGGSGMPSQNASREFTGTEESLLARLAEGLVGALAEVWGEVIAVKPQLRSRETNVSFAAIAKGDEPVAVCRFTIVPGRGDPAPVEIVYPVAALRSVEAELAAKSTEEVSARGGEWRERLAAAVGSVRVKARTVLARPELSLAELMELRAGDVIPVSLPAHVPLLVEGRPVALGTIGEHDGRAALRIEKIDTRRISQ